MADSRKIELVARETEIGSLTDKLSEHRREQKDLRTYSREIELENKAAQESLKQERKRYHDLEKKSERLMTQLSDREEKLDRREKEAARLREQLRAMTGDGQDVDKRLVDSDRARLALEAENAELTARLASLLGNARGGDIEKAFKKLEEDRDRLKKQVATLSAQKAALEDRQMEEQIALAAGWDDERRDTAVLREQINDIAAEVVRMTAALEGPNSPIHAALNSNTPGQDGQSRDSKLPLSLADRVRALQKAASARN